MIIKQLACERFAGVRDADLRFEPGMNILLGDNESGKSTMADLLYHLFFQESKPDGRKDKVFLDTCFPKGVDADGDIIDGTVRFDTENGSYKLYKEWAAGGNVCRLTLPAGTRISKPKEIRKILDEELRYGRGIYDEVVFASQKRQHALLTGLLDQSKDTAMQELAATLNQAVLETGGVSLDKVEQQLLENMQACAGRWDFAAGQPEGGRARGIRNPWKVGCGSILAAYYALETAAENQRSTEQIERTIEDLNARLREARQGKQAAADRRERFAACQGIISSRASLNDLLNRELSQLQTLRTAAERWPRLEADRIQAQTLETALSRATNRQLYLEVSGLKQQLQDQSARLEAIGTIDPAQIRSAETNLNTIRTLEAKIQGLNLAAKLRLLGDTPVSVVSAASGEAVDTGDGSFSITEAVEIRVPGVMELQLMPRGVDLDRVRTELARAREALAAVYEKYHVDSVAALRENAQEARSLQISTAALDNQIAARLNGQDWETIAAAADPDADTVSNVQARIRTLCGYQSIDSFLGSLNGQIRSLEEQYLSPEKLAEAIAASKGKAEACRRKLSEIDEIPAEYRNITDPDGYAARLKAEAEEWEVRIDDLHNRLRDNQLPADSKSAEEYAEDCRRLTEKFEAEKARYHHWAHIYEVFTRLKQHSNGDPTRDIQRNFQSYLTELSGGGLRLNSMDEKLRSTLASGNSRLTGTILSEGTRDTISLAFRLAMLEHLFPDGGAVAIFDDPFTDMDPRRTAQACRLLQRFAQRNQVLFITCDEKYTNLLTGSVIHVDAR